MLALIRMLPFICLDGKNAISGCTVDEGSWLNPKDCTSYCHLTNCPVLPAAIEAALMGGKGGSMSRRAHRNKAQHGTRAGLSKNGPSIRGKRELTHGLRPLFSQSLRI
jgi:hypothetical protein